LRVFRLTDESEVNSLALGEFFASNVTPSYISHGEVSCGRARSLTEWVPNLEEVVALEVRDALTQEKETKQVWVALEEERIVGLSIVSFQSGEIATFEDMVVQREGRSRGYGEEFFRTILSLMKQERPELRVGLCESGLHNEGAHQFIERIGFVPISKVFLFQFSGD